MLKDKMKFIRDYIVKHSKIVFPILVIAVVAMTVVVALNANDKRGEGDEDSILSVENSLASTESTPTPGSPDPTADVASVVPEEVPMVANTDPALYSLAATYFNAVALGDEVTLVDVYDEISENDLLRYVETAKYLDYYTALEVYTKPGPAEGIMLAYVYYKVRFVNHEEEFPGYQTLYVCTDEEGNLYIKNENNFTEDEIEYVKTVTEHADVVDFNNRVEVEYNELMLSKPELLDYLSELGTQVNTAIGLALAAQNAETGQPSDGGNQGGENTDTPNPTEEPVAENTVQYATATTTVNVRSSDSEKADRLGQVSGGSRVQVQEVRVNGWTKIVYEGKDGFIKSEYLQMEENADGLEVIGKVTATTNINIRAAASETATKLGILLGGESLELLGNENGWCKVKYNGQVAYVKADYVTQ